MVEKPTVEPSMDDILASIRQIISGDSKGEEQSASPSKDEEPILDLTDALPDEAESMINHSKETASPYLPKPLTDPERALIEKLMEESEKENFFVPLKEFSEENLTMSNEHPTPYEDTFISEAVLSETAQALSPLNKILQEKSKPVETPLKGEMGGQTVENLVRETLKPLLKEWLDAHLPSLVRGIVKEQVEKIVHKR